MTQEHREAAKALFDRGLHIGGSRYMAAKYPDKIAITDDTDWDFYCDDTIEKRVLLTGLGFEKVEAENRNYWDDLLIDIYKHPTLPFEVLLRKDVEIYRSAFDAISAEVFIGRLWKSSPTANPELCRAAFRSQCCEYFNGLFRLHGWKNLCNIADPNDLPF